MITRPDKQHQKTHFFISYSRRNSGAVGRVYDYLRQRGYELWMDKEDESLRAGDEWLKKIDAAIEQADVVIAFISPDFIASKSCQYEIQQALKTERTITPLIVDTLPSTSEALEKLGIQNRNAIEIRQDPDDFQRDMGEFVKVLPHPPQSWNKRGRWLLGVAISLASAVVLGVITTILSNSVVSVVTPTLTAIPTPTALPPTPTPYAVGELGIGVAYFDTSGLSADDAARADRLVEAFASQLKEAMPTALQNVSVTFDVLPPQMLDRIGVSDAQLSAAQIAKNHHLKIVVYGSAYPQGNLLSVEPKFYVDPIAFASANEITGNYRFGEVITVGPSADVSTELRSRAEIIASIFAGIILPLQNKLDAAGALALFEFAKQKAALDSDTSGLEVLDILIGIAHVNLADRAIKECNREVVIEHIHKAIAAYDAAIADTQSEYFRPFSGRGAARFMLSRWLAPENDGCADEIYNLPMIAEALEDIEHAFEVGDLLEAEPLAAARLYLNKTRIHFIQCVLLPGPMWTQQDIDDACADFETTSESLQSLYRSRSNPAIAREMPELYAMHGDLAQIAGNYYDAIDFYDDGLAIEGIAPDKAMYLTTYKADAKYMVCQLNEAASLYDSASRVAEQLELPDFAAEYRSIRDDIFAQIRDQQGHCFAVTPTP